MIQSTNTNQQNNTVLEQYVFEVAARFIDQVPPQDQARLINLFNSIEKASRPNNSLTENSQEMGNRYQATSRLYS